MEPPHVPGSPTVPAIPNRTLALFVIEYASRQGGRLGEPSWANRTDREPAGPVICPSGTADRSIPCTRDEV